MFVQEPLSLLEWLDPPEIRKMFSENYLDFVFVLLLRASVIRAWACACANERRVFGVERISVLLCNRWLSGSRENAVLA